MERFVVCRSHSRAGDDRVVRKVLSQIVLAAGLVLAGTAAFAQGRPLTPEEAYAADVRAMAGVDADEAFVATFIAETTAIFVMAEGQPRPQVERVMLAVEQPSRAREPPRVADGEVVWTATGAGLDARLSGAVSYIGGATAAVWIAWVEAAAPTLEFGIRIDGEVGALVRDIYQVSAGGRYLIAHTPIVPAGTQTGPRALVARVSGSDLETAATLLRQSEVLSITVLALGGSMTVSLMLGATGTPLLEALLAAAGL